MRDIIADLTNSCANYGSKKKKIKIFIYYIIDMTLIIRGHSRMGSA